MTTRSSLLALTLATILYTLVGCGPAPQSVYCERWMTSMCTLHETCTEVPSDNLVSNMTLATMWPDDCKEMEQSHIFRLSSINYSTCQITYYTGMGYKVFQMYDCNIVGSGYTWLMRDMEDCDYMQDDQCEDGDPDTEDFCGDYYYPNECLYRVK